MIDKNWIRTHNSKVMVDGAMIKLSMVTWYFC